MSATQRFHQAANDALVKISEHCPPGAKLALVIYTPGEPEKDIVFECAIEPAIRTWGDRYYLSRAVENLVVNAIRYAPRSGIVRMRLSRQGKHACLSIFNSGEGISPDELPRVFERYYHRSETTRANSSSGLGLSIAWAVIQKHRGSIEVESSPGQGCTFKVWLPLLEGEENAEAYSSLENT